MKMAERTQSDKLSQLCQPERGFSLLEMMIAIVVITFGLVSIVAISAYVSRANATSNIISVVTTAAQTQADKLRGAVWSKTAEDAKLTVGGNLDYYSADANHRTTFIDTPVGTVLLSWKVVAGPATTGDMRTITIKAVQESAPARLADGFSITIIIAKN